MEELFANTFPTVTKVFMLFHPIAEKDITILCRESHEAQFNSSNTILAQVFQIHPFASHLKLSLWTSMPSISTPSALSHDPEICFNLNLDPSPIFGSREITLVASMTNDQLFIMFECVLLLLFHPSTALAFSIGV